MSLEFVYEEETLRAEDEILSEVREILRARTKQAAMQADVRDARNRIVVKKEHIPRSVKALFVDVLCS